MSTWLELIWGERSTCQGLNAVQIALGDGGSNLAGGGAVIGVAGEVSVLDQAHAEGRPQGVPRADQIGHPFAAEQVAEGV
ncbi:hypothetical protein KBY96_01815 [Cyanobium sp. ATX 6A2]|nr:hypothetical protein [Cyanobium sp. ATX 6A2]